MVYSSNTFSNVNVVGVAISTKMKLQWFETVLVVCILGLATWTVKKVADLDKDMVRIETDEHWIKEFLLKQNEPNSTNR